MFKCKCCGLCCRNLHSNPIFKNMHNGNGICKYLDEDTNLCLIYDTRPLICRIDDGYEILFKEKMSKEDYYRLNYEICKRLREGGV